MTASTPNLAALLAAAREEPPDRVALLLLADLAEEAGDDDLAGNWHWLADVPATGWERRAWGLLPAPHEAYYGPHPEPWARARVGRVLDGVEEIEAYVSGHGVCTWDCYRRWRDASGKIIDCPPGVRATVLAACRATLAERK